MPGKRRNKISSDNAFSGDCTLLTRKNREPLAKSQEKTSFQITVERSLILFKSIQYFSSKVQVVPFLQKEKARLRYGNRAFSATAGTPDSDEYIQRHGIPDKGKRGTRFRSSSYIKRSTIRQQSPVSMPSPSVRGCASSSGH